MTEILRTDGQRIRRMSVQGRTWLVGLEGGCKLRAYKDGGGVWTIGVGMTRWPTGARVKSGDELPNIATGMEAFERGLKRYEVFVDDHIRDNVSQIEMDALTALAYNNESAVQPKTSTMARLFNAGEPLAKVLKQWARWIHVNGKVDKGLVERRACEADLLLYGVYRTQGQKRERAA